MKTILYFILLCLCLFDAKVLSDQEKTHTDQTTQNIEKKNPNISVAYLISKNMTFSNYPNALESLLKTINQLTTLRINIAPVIITSLDDEKLFNCPFLYFNLGDSNKWEWKESEIETFKKYIQRGGFVYIDAGIQASFLENVAYQNHSFAEWRPSEKLIKLFEPIFPNKIFAPLPKTHDIFKAFKVGLPDTSKLPVTVKEYVENEKWPGGTYSVVGLTINGRLSVVATPIVAMGWGKTEDGRWTNNIMMRIKENADKVQNTLAKAQYDGEKFPVTNEDLSQDMVFVQGDKPAWALEPSGRWRIFKYYGGNEINDFAHNYFTQLGINFIFYALTH